MLRKHKEWKVIKLKGYNVLVGENYMFRIPRLLMEYHLNRKLYDEEEVHHINGIRDDDRIENLEICYSAKEHRKLHQKKK